MMYDNTEKLPRAILVAVDTGEYDAETSLLELEELARTAGVEVAATSIQKRPAPDSATVVGSGRLRELTEDLERLEADMLIFDCELTGSQTLNIGDVTGVAVVDRTALILDIFAGRARSAEGRLQVELAQLQYLLPRLAGSRRTSPGWAAASAPGDPAKPSWKPTAGTSAPASRSWTRSGGTHPPPGTCAPPQKDGIITAAIVGYTNVGKSTLLNALTEAGVLAENKLFATLDPTARALLLPDGRSVMLIDTVGLVRRLPHNLVEAFKSTLEEAASADVLLCVCDASSPEMDEQIEVTTSLLAELGAADTPMIKVLNKCDLVPGLRPLDRKDTVLISAREKTGFEELLSAIMAALEPSQKRLKLLLPYTAAGLLAEIRQEGKVFSEEYTPDGILADALVHIRVLHKVAPYQIS